MCWSNKDLFSSVSQFYNENENAKAVIQPQIKVSFYQSKKNKSCKGADKSRRSHPRK